MKYSILLIFIMGILSLQSCNKETFYQNEFDEDIDLREGNLREKKECIELVYPLGIVMPDETVITVEDEEELISQIKAWYKLNPNSKERPGLNYPVKVTFEGDRSKIIKSEEQMKRLKKYCDDNSTRKRKVCFKLLFPVTYDLPDGTTISGESDLEIRSLLKEWYKSNPDSDQKPELFYPVEIKIVGGDIITINNEDEIIEIKKRCSEKEERVCFKLDFPVGFTMPDGSTISIDNEEELNAAIKTWYQENPDSDVKPSINYPVDVVFADGKTWTVNNEEEMIKLKKKCSEGK